MFAVNTDAVAMPLESVRTVSVLVPLPEKVPLAPLEGAVKVTEAPLTGLLDASRTVACKLVVKAVPPVADCGVPAVALMLAGEEEHISNL